MRIVALMLTLLSVPSPATPQQLCEFLIREDVQLTEELDAQLFAIAMANIMCTPSTVIQGEESTHPTCPNVRRLIADFCTALHSHLSQASS